MSKPTPPPVPPFPPTPATPSPHRRAPAYTMDDQMLLTDGSHYIIVPAETYHAHQRGYTEIGYIRVSDLIPPSAVEPDPA